VQLTAGTRLNKNVIQSDTNAKLFLFSDDEKLIKQKTIKLNQ